jgi:hypothetical protein
MLAGRRAMVTATTGAAGVMFNAAGMCGAMEAALWPIHNVAARRRTISGCGRDVFRNNFVRRGDCQKNSACLARVEA